MSEQKNLINSRIISHEEIDEELFDEMIDEIGEIPGRFFETEVILTVIVTPLIEEKSFSITECIN